MVSFKELALFQLSYLQILLFAGPQPLVQRHHVSSELYNTLATSAHLMDIAYCISPITKIESPFYCENDCDAFPDLEVIDQWCTNDISVIPTSFETSGYIALNQKLKQILLVLRGTRSFKDSLIDINADMVDYVIEENATRSTPFERSTKFGCEVGSGGCKIHRGFYESYRLTWERIEPTFQSLGELIEMESYQVRILGHSLGGAISILLAIKILNLFDLEGFVSCVTMGQPMIGNDRFCEYVDVKFGLASSDGTNERIIRVTHKDDPIVKLPIDDHHLIGSDDYHHFGGEIFIKELGTQLPQLENVYHCYGSQDLECSYGMRFSRRNYEHLNYFRHMGHCGFGF